MRTHHHFLPSTSSFSTWNALALTRFLKGVAVHKLLTFRLIPKCLVWIWGSRWPVYDLCWGNPKFPLAPVILTLLWDVKPATHLHHNLKSCDTYEELVGSKPIPSKPLTLNYVYHGYICFFLINCRYSWDLTPQNLLELQQILSACHISHNSPGRMVKVLLTGQED